MITPAFAAQPCARPFYNRGLDVTPLAPYTYQGLGTASASSVGGVSSLVIPNCQGAVGEVVFGAICVDNQINVDNILVTMDGDPFKGGINWFYDVDKALFSYYVPMNGVPRMGAIVFDFSLCTGLPTKVTGLASRASTLNQGGGAIPLDKTKGGGGAGTNQDSGLTANTVQAHEFIYGLIATDGFGVDALGAWTAPLVAGQRASNVNGLDLKEGFAWVNAIGTYRAQVTGATSRAWRALCQTFTAA